MMLRIFLLLCHIAPMYKYAIMIILHTYTWELYGICIYTADHDEVESKAQMLH